MKHKVEWTAPALLAGMWSLMMILDALDQYPIEELKEMGRLLKQMLGLDDKPSNVKKNLCIN